MDFRTEGTTTETELLRKTEYQVSSQQTFLGELDARSLLHELQVHQVELEMQNEQLRQIIAEKSKLEILHDETLIRIEKIASRVPGILYQFMLRPDGSTCFPYTSNALIEICHVRPEEVREDASKLFALIHPDDYETVIASVQRSALDLTPWCHEYRVKRDDGVEIWLFGNAIPQKMEDASILWHGFIYNVTERKRMEVELKSYTKELEDANTALRIFMDRRECTGMMLEEKLQFNVDELVAPYLKKLRETELNSRQENYLNVLENNLKNIVSPYMFKMSTTYKNLTPQEIQIANLIRLGKNTKDIAELLNTSAHTVGTHRNNIRKKMKLRNSKSNLRSHLLSLI